MSAISERDIVVMQLFSDGFSHKEIADYFSVSPSLISQRIRMVKEQMVGLLLGGVSVYDMTERYLLSAEVIAEYIFNHAKNQAESSGSSCDHDRWDEISYLVSGISSPEQTRNERRKEIDSRSMFGTLPIAQSDKKPKRAGSRVIHAACIGCGAFRECDDMFFINVGSVENTYVCQGCMEDAIYPLLAPSQDGE